MKAQEARSWWSGAAQMVKVSKDAHAIAQALAEKNHAMFHHVAAIQVKPPIEYPPDKGARGVTRWVISATTRL